MIYPPIFQICAANAAMVDLVGDSEIVRVFLFGEAERIYGGQVPTPYVVWQQIGGAPENMLDTVPDADTFSVQFDVYAKTASEARAVGEALRNAIEPHCYITSWRGDGRDYETRLYRFSFDTDWMTHRAVPVPPVDKSALVAVLDAAAELNEEDYTPESWEVLADAVAAGELVYDDPTATQDQVDEASTAINDAIQGLVPDVPPIGCSFPLSGDIAALIPGGIGRPLVVSGAGNQTVETPEPLESYFYAASSEVPFTTDIDWPANEIRWVSQSVSEFMDLGGSRGGIAVGFVDNSFTLVRGALLFNSTDWVAAFNTLENGGPTASQGEITNVSPGDIVSVGVSGDGAVWYRCGSEVIRAMDMGSPGAPYFLTNLTGFGVVATAENTSGLATGHAKSTVITDAASMGAFPEIAGMTQADWCGNPVEVAPP